MKADRLAIIVFIVITTIFILILISFIVFVLFLYQRKHIKHRKRMDDMTAEFNVDLQKTRVEIQEQTFQTISMEIHDDIGLTLTLAKLSLNTIDWNDTIRTKEQVAVAIDYLSEGIEDLRYISKSLRTDFLEANGLQKTLDLDIDRMKDLGQYKIDYTVSGKEIVMEKDKEIFVYRIMQEVLNNCIKHANARQITISMNYRDEDLIVEISDDGQGFSINDETAKAGTGLKNIETRAKLIKGECTIQSEVGKGTTIKMKIPYYYEHT